METIDFTPKKFRGEDVLFLTQEDPYVVITFYNPGTLADEWLQSLDSYTQVSPNGNDYQSIVKAPDYDESDYNCDSRLGNIQVQSRGEFRLTGDCIPLYGVKIRENSQALDTLGDVYIGRKDDVESMSGDTIPLHPSA